ncbi:MAG TPA: potassium channel protein [Chloroflexota bacterium]
MRRPFLPRNLVLSVALFIVVLVVGVAGFVLEGLTPVDAVFTTVSAVTTVGYTPSRPLSSPAKIFATFLILGGVGTGLYVLGSLTDFLVEGGLHGSWRERKLWRELNKLKDHYIVSGFGRVGQRVATQLTDAGMPFVVVDTNPETIKIAQDRGLLYFEGDATSDVVLEAVGVKRAQALLACSDSDVKNVYMTLSARSLNESLYIVARAGDPDAEQKLYAAGASRVVSPYVMAGNRMAHLAVQPMVADYVDVMVRGHNLGFQIEERVVPHGSPLSGQTVGEIRHGQLAGGHVLAIERDSALVTDVNDDLTVVAGDRVLIAGTPSQLKNFDATAT